MKKILAVFLALILFAGAKTACADRLGFINDGGTTTACHVRDFKTYFNDWTGRFGYSFRWDRYGWPDPYYVFDVYYATSEDGTMKLRVYCRNEYVPYEGYSNNPYVSYVECEGSLTASIDDLTFDSGFGRWLAIHILSICLALADGEVGTAEAFTRGNIEEELKTLVNDVLSRLSREEELKNGRVILGDCMGYRVGVEISGSLDGTEASVNMKMAVVNSDGELFIRTD